ncbi:fused MFS/spermidine synthase [Sphingosinicella sp. YJ22]|uniref:fused MFS/spermidine synthase n=1 Tax=Sphingosinicella sp. YJ22 TaxID=1104780 RepID=UPI001408F2FF|nr:fused MFS/spermidine synthase [Sphingosinicella sp. YJ22]
MSQESVLGAKSNERFARPLFLTTIVVGSFLLFLTQPMVARMALPRVGGAPAVWNSAMLVYQLLLLAGYAYAHYLGRVRPRYQVGIHVILLGVAALWLPLHLVSWVPPTTSQPAFWVPWFLLASIGPLFFIVSAQAPLMQRWYALETSRGDPYPLYAASNLGSFAGLISYPLLVEPLMTLQEQSYLWTGLYAVLVLLVIGCAVTVPGHAVEKMPEETAPKPPPKRVLRWIALAAVPSGLMLSTTTHLTTDIVAIPLLWVLPLGLYLLSFVVAFAARRKVADFITLLAPVVILIAGGLAFASGSRDPLVAATLGLLLLFTIAVALHTQMFRLRPAVGHLTRFYLAMSFGGMLGGLFCAIVAPLVFDWAYEHPLLILAAALLVPQTPLLGWPRHLSPILTVALPGLALVLSLATFLYLRDTSVMAGTIVVSLLALACLGRPLAFMISLAALMLSYGGWQVLYQSTTDTRTRSYFGIYQVNTRYNDAGEAYARALTHGTTLHGIQNLVPGTETVATSYYARRSGVGHALANAPQLFGPNARIGVVGLGTGTLSCYRQPGQNWTIFEIDPVMVDIARNRFSFLSRCAPDARIVLGDARVSLANAAPNSIDILAVDAFSSDAVPMHLLTHEALGVYGRAVQPDGIVLFHVSNRYLDLKPVVADLAERGGWQTAMLEYDPTEDEQMMNATVSVWIALSRNPASLDRLVQASGDDAGQWLLLQRTPGFAGWSDDYASILPILRPPEMPWE